MKKFFKTLALVFVILCASMAKAMAADVFVISGVPIAGEADTAAKAKEIALMKGSYQAFVDLLDIIVAESDRDKITIADKKFAEQFVLDVSVANEKAGSTKYYGALTVRFNAPKVRQFLESLQVGFLARLPQPAVVIPVLKNEYGIQVFSLNNPLFKALRDNMPSNRLFQFQTVAGDEADDKMAKECVFFQNKYACNDLAQKYFVTQLLVLEVDKQGTKYTVSTHVWPSGAAPEAEVSFKTTDDRESETKVMIDLLNDTIRNMSKKWHYLSQNSAAPITVYQVFAPIEKVSDLSRMKQKLARLNFADKVDIKGFSNKQLAVDFHYRGTITELSEKLRLNQLILTAGTNEQGELVYRLIEADRLPSFDDNENMQPQEVM